MDTEKYFKNLEKEVRKVYRIAEEARAKNFDPEDKVEIPLAITMAAKVVGLISSIYPQMINSGIDKRILQLEKQYGKLNTTVVFKIAEEVAKQKFCKFSSLLEAIDAGIRVGFAYITLGVVSSPIEGYTGLKLGKTREGKEYFIAYFSGPIRSAGTTASCVALMLIDYLRELFGYAKYDPTEEEVKRYIAECYDYHERVTNLQYIGTEEEFEFLAKNLPIQIAGESTEKIEVSNYKNLERVDTNYIRGGMALIFSEGLAQKAAKGFRLLNEAKKNGIKSTGFDFLEEYIKLHEKSSRGGEESDERPTYIKDLVAGRPVFGYPSMSGGFRMRYGRSRVNGFSAVSLNPATMAITDSFISTGTQLKIEKPTKGCVVTNCDSIDGPIVKLFNGDVKKIRTKEEAKKVYPDVEEIIYLGDILFPYSDVVNRNAQLIKPGYVEEWWNSELEKAGGKIEDYFNVSFEEAIKLSQNYKIPLHPKFIFFWTQIDREQFFELINWLKASWIKNKKIIFPYYKSEEEKFEKGKRALEILGVEHGVSVENVVIEEEIAKFLFCNLGLDINLLNKQDFFLKEIISEMKDKISEEYKLNSDLEKENILSLVNNLSDFIIKDKAGEFIGSRMGRPEKAKLRKLTGSPNLLFPVGKEGGRLRSVQAACEEGKIRSDFPTYYCEDCKKETIYPSCEICGKKTRRKYSFLDGEKSFDKKRGDEQGIPYSSISLDINYYLEKAKEKLKINGQEIPPLIKGVRGTSSEGHIMENLCKGILRAKYNLQVNKDGTIRFDATELPLTAFKPKEIFVSIEKLKELGYDKDIFGKELVNEEQILELMPHDVLLPSCPESPDEKADDVFIKISNFVDDLLVRFYGLKPIHNIKKREDLVGQLGVCMAPHNCAGVVSRIIGFSENLGLLASPYMHAAIRRDCFDYDTYIIIRKNGEWKNEKIGKIVEFLKPKKIVDDYGTKEKKVNGFEAIGFDKNLKKVKINNFTKHTKTKMYEIKTSLGKKIKVTGNHKFFVDNKLKKVNHLKIGDELPLPYDIKIPSKEIRSINLIEHLDKKGLMVRKISKIINKIPNKEKENFLSKLKISKKQFQNYKLRDSFPVDIILLLNKKIQREIFEKGFLGYKRDSGSVPINISLSNDLLEVLGLYIAEGYSRRIVSQKGLNQVYIAADKKEIREHIKKTIKNSFNLIPSEKKEDRVTFSSRILYEFFVNILKCGSIAKFKRIPSMFLNLKKEKLASLLRGYFEGDGSVSTSDKRVTCDSISFGLLSDLEFCLSRFGIFCKRYDYEKKPGPKVREFYINKEKNIPKFKITKLIIGSDFIKNYNQIGFISKTKKENLEKHNSDNHYGMRIKRDDKFIYDPIVSIKYLGKRESYSLNVNTKNHLVVANSILSHQCDGDEAAIMLLSDVLLNFSRKFLPTHRGGTQDAPLVLNAKINAGEVDDQILDFEIISEKKYPLELYEKAENKKHSSEVKIFSVKDALKEGKNPFLNLGYTHETSNFNKGVRCSSYKYLSTMQEKVKHQMELVERLRAVDTSDTAKLMIDRHFLRDIKGNLRNFSVQSFRCVKCNAIMRRPPLSGICEKCGGRLIFTVNEGGIKKYLELATELAKKYNLPVYTQQNLDLVKRAIDSTFGKELEKQKGLQEWFSR